MPTYDDHFFNPPAPLVDCSISFRTNFIALLLGPGIQIAPSPGPFKRMSKATVVFRPTEREVLKEMLTTSGSKRSRYFAVTARSSNSAWLSHEAWAGG